MIYFYIMLFNENQTTKMEFFSRILIFKMRLKMNSRIITKSYTADPEIGFLTKPNFQQ